jgi:hypothetical protein
MDNLDVALPVQHNPKDHTVACLKSHLQKMVRRKSSDLAVKTARRLLLLDPMSLLRRLPIIMIEDVMLLPALWPLVWLMMAYPFRGLTDEDCEWILGVVHKLVTHDWSENLLEEAPDADWRPEITDPLVGAIAIRHEYGGLRGDKPLMIHSAWTWQQRRRRAESGEHLSWFSLQIHQHNSCITPIPLVSIEPLLASEFNSVALDHHITPITRLLPSGGGKNWAQIIWDCSSSRNPRTRLDMTLQERPYWSDKEAELVHSAQERMKERMLPEL